MSSNFLLASLVVVAISFSQCTNDFIYPGLSVNSALTLESRSSMAACDDAELISKNVISCGLTRAFYIQLPLGFHPDSTYPLLFAFHGHGSGTDKACAWKDRIGEWIDLNKFIGVYPRAYNDDYWYVGDPMPDAPITDVCFVNQIKEKMMLEYHIDALRIYAMGTSNGGGLSLHLARSVDWLAAITTLAASTWEGYSLAFVPVLPIMHVHGDLDGTVPYIGGYSAGIGLTFNSARQADSIWAVENNLCPITPKNQTITVGAQFIYKTSWCSIKQKAGTWGGIDISPLALKKEVIHYRLHDIHHNLYSEISYDTKVKMNNDIFAFFKRHHL
ncbi:MAG: hypothetical protein ABI844_09975 [Saprospiraceae bacterium]